MPGTFFKKSSWNICSCCKESKQETEFYMHSNGKLRKQCKICFHKNRKPIAKEAIASYQKKHREKFIDKHKERVRQWRKENLKYDAFRSSVYRATKINQTPIWADLEKIKLFYLNCPSGYHVDHIVQLRGKLFSGLHTIDNLQYLPATENIKKGNRYVG